MSGGAPPTALHMPSHTVNIDSKPVCEQTQAVTRETVPGRRRVVSGLHRAEGGRLRCFAGGSVSACNRSVSIGTKQGDCNAAVSVV